MSAPGRCSELSESVGEPLDGTAPTALGWVALEQPGPWGARAWRESPLDPELGVAIEAAATAHQIRAVLVRAPGREAGPGPWGADQRVLVASSGPGTPWLLRADVADPAALLDLDWPALAAGDRAAVRASLDGSVVESRPHLLVCANGKRDACCALAGRPVAAAGALEHPGRVWETTHLSGHRFAPTALLLPSGWAHGRLGPDDAGALVRAAEDGRVDLDSVRGRSLWPPAGQVAEVAVRRRAGAAGADDVREVVPSAGADGERWTVRLADGRTWSAEVARQDTGRLRPESCGRADAELAPYTAVEVVEVTDPVGS